VTLLNGLLALGALAFTVPLAIHLLYRSRFRTLPWGAMHLLETVVRTNRRRIELMNWLLLLLRCLLPIVLAFCLARPVLTGFRALPGESPQSVVIAVDNSLSMAARDVDGAPRIDRVKRQLASLVGNLSRQDEVILITSGDGDAAVESIGSTLALSKLQWLDANTGPTNLGALVRSAVDAANQARHVDRRVLIVSDFQSNMVDEAAIESLTGLKTTLANQPITPSIQFWNVGGNSSQLSNVSVDAIRSESAAVVAGRASRFSASIQNAGDAPVRDVRLNWTVAGKSLPPRTVTIPPRSTVTVRLTHTIDQAGVHPLSVGVEMGDALPSDNVRTIGVDVIRQVDVLLVDGDPGNRPLTGETDFLAIALSPFAFGGQDQPDAVRTTIVPDRKLVQTLEKQNTDVVVLANVRRLDQDARTALATFVNGGGAMVIFDGDRVEPKSYNTAWMDGETAWPLPMTLGESVGGDASPDATTYPVGTVDGQYSAWSFLSDDGSGASVGNASFADVDVFGYRKLLPATEAVDDPTRTLIRFVNGDPLAVMATRGRGRVVQFAIPCDLAKTNLPTRLIFLPLIQQLTLDLAGSQTNATINVGTPLQVPTRELAAQVPDDAEPNEKASPKFTLVDPSGTETNVDVGDDGQGMITIENTRSAGIYRLRRRVESVAGDPIVTQTMRVATIPPSESLLRDAETSRVTRAAELVGGTVGDELASLSADDQTRRFGREIWRWLLVALLIAMIGEVWLQQRGSGKSTARAKTSGPKPTTSVRPIGGGLA
jgi:hypothetical protein